MNPKDMELEDRQESDVWQNEGGGRGGVGDDESNRAPSGEDQAALIQRQLEEKSRLEKDIQKRNQEVNARLKQEKEELQQEKEELQQEKEELKQEKEKLKQEKEKLKQEKEKLKQEKEELDENASVKALLETHGGIPSMKENTSAKPSLGGEPSAKNTLKRNQAEHGAAVGASQIAMIAIDDDEVVGKQQHAPADIKSMRERVLKCLQQFPLNLKDRKGYLVKSMIAVSMAKNSTNKEATLTNFNERSVFLHVMHLLQDVLQCLHLSSRVDVGQEISIFSMRPDVVVVRWESKIILVIEVKNAGKDGTLVMNDTNAAGQAYDYAMGLCQMGNEHPFVCLSTYNYMRIGTIKPLSKNLFSEAVRKLKMGMIQDVNPRQYKPQKETISPEEKGNPIMIPDDSKMTQLEDENEIGKSGQGGEPKRVIYFSEIFDRTNIFQALCFAVACGLVAAEESTHDGNEMLVPKEGAEIEKCVAVVRKTSFHWEHLKCTATYQLKSQWQKDMRVFLHCVLGQGCSGKVYLASDSSGQMFAVKLYLYEMESFRGDKNQEEQKSQKEVAMEICEVEAQNWITYYPSFKEAIFLCELFGVPCLAMPYVAPIPMERRRGLLPKIEEELKRFAKERLVYPVSDLHWHHIGLRTNEKREEQIILVDLELMQKSKQGEESILRDDLEVPSENGVNNSYDAVNSAIIDLGEWAGEPVSTPQGFIHR